ncbi:MAG TPA: TonB-dependent receptor [Bryobacteraceae bacterium]|nr:TonB-dependent receptor [Bryobacteraceae bacterium]
MTTALACASSSVHGQSTATLRGQVTDPSGAAITGATVALASTAGDIRSAQTGPGGAYQFGNLPTGAYSIRITASGFAEYSRPSVELAEGRFVTLDVRLPLATAQQEITVADTIQVELDPARNVSATVLQGQNLDVLSDDPDDLLSDLQQLAGPAAGPNGGQVFVDGFSNGQLPPKSSIREIRVNSNPLSAEYDKIGLGRIEILTKPGTDKLHGSAFAQFDDGSWDARNPFAQSKPSFLTRQLEGNIAGSPAPKASIFLDYMYRRQDDQALVNATVLDAAFHPVPLVENAPAPNTRAGISSRLDYQLTPNVTLQGRYAWARYATDNSGVGQFNLPITGTNARSYNHLAQAIATWAIDSATVNETRFQYVRSDNPSAGINYGPTINVAGAFTGNAAASGSTFLNQDAYEFQNYTTLTRGAHLIKFGARLRGTLQDTGTDSNFNGTFSFASIGAYAATLSGLAQGLPWPQILATGGGAFQYAVTKGNRLASAALVDAGPFFQDDWRVKPNFTVSLGLRYEVQNGIGDKRDLAPRAGIAWGLGKTQGGRPPKTVVRAGFGIFYDRIGLPMVINAERLNGVNQQRYVLPSPAFFIDDTPPLTQLAAGQPVTSYRIDPSLMAPRVYQSTASVERQLPKNITLSLSYVNSRGVYQLRTRNINAPLPSTYVFGDPTSGIYPLGADHNPVDQYESSGLYKQSQVVANVNARVNTKFSMFGYYAWGRASSNTDGVNTFPANSYDESGEWSRAQFDVRNRLVTGGNVTLPLAIRLAPAIAYYSPSPYNLIIGNDLNGDGQNNDRPSYATSADNPAYVLQTIYGPLNLRPLPGETIVPRNLGTGFASFSVNLRVSRTWGFGEPTGSADTQGGGGNPMRHYNVTLSVEARNLLNVLNPGTPVGVLSSPLFGEAQGLSTISGGVTQSANRRLQMQLRFAF